MSSEQHITYADVETSSADYATRFSGAEGQWLLEVQNSLVKRCAEAACRGLETPAALDVGGGHGQLLAPLSEAGYQLTILGSRPECASRVAQEVAGQRCSFLTGDLCRVPLPDASYHLVTCIRLLTHCEQWRTVVHELCRLSAHSVIIDYPPLLSFNLMYPVLFKVKKILEGNTRSFELFRHREIENEFRSNGFTLKERYGQFFLPMVVHRCLKKPEISKNIEAIFSALAMTQVFGSPVIARFERCT